MQRPKITLDISVLGTGHFLSRARTGIARAIENLAIRLAERSEIDLYFSAYQSLDVFFKTREYLKSQPALKSENLVLSNDLFTLSLFRVLEKFGFSDLETLKKRTFASRAKGRLLCYLASSQRIVNNQFDLARPSEQDIFHSPFLPLPKRTGKQGQKSRFITIYDLIPVLFPQYFKFGEHQNLVRTIKSIGPEDHIFAISESTKNDLCNYASLDPSRVFVTPLAAGEKFFPCVDQLQIADVKQKYNIPAQDYVLSVCTLEPRKNIEQTIRSFADLVHQQKIQNLNLVLVGAVGWKTGGIFAEINRDKLLSQRIVVTGYVLDEDLSPLYSGSKMFIYPSYYEGFGLPPLEAMKCGVPVITSNTSSLPEVVGDAGILISPDDGDALSQAMLEIYSNEGLHSSLSRKGLIQASKFSWETCADKTLSAYLSVL